MTRAEHFPTAAMNAVDELLGPALSQGLEEQPALIGDQQSLTYGELNRLVNRYGNAFKAAGIERENRVLFLLSDSPDMVAAYLAVIRIGGVAVAINVRATPEELLFAIRDSDCKVVLLDEAFLPAYQKIAQRVPQALTVLVEGDGQGIYTETQSWIAAHSGNLKSEQVSPDAMAFWVYTSGTTGIPKAAVHLHHDVIVADLHLRENLGVKAGDRIFSTSKLFFAYALGHSLFGALKAGATAILYKAWPDTAAVARLVEQHRPDLVFSVPTFYRNLLRDGAAESDAFRGVRHFISAGEKLPETLFEQWQAATGRPILEGIGTSETLFFYLGNTPARCRAGSCGRLMPWAEVRLLDENEQLIAEPDTPGQLWVRMASVADRYWNRQDQSRKAFHGHWYNTGDMFSFDREGWWTHHGRGDDMLKISGQWVSPSEIEGCALRVPEVEDSVVVGIANSDGLVRPALFVVPAEACDEEQLSYKIRDTLIKSLSIYKCPRIVKFIDEVPRTATGKAQKFKLRELLDRQAHKELFETTG